MDRWPDFTGDDLVSRYPGIALTNLCADGATIGVLTGTALAYRPPGHTLKGGHRAPATGDYEPWTPN